MNKKDHWNKLYNNKKASEVTWFQKSAKTTLSMIESLSLDKTDEIIDVGAGASTLLDDLIEKGHEKISVLDISEGALNQTRKRLAQTCLNVEFIVGDVTKYIFDKKYKLWHDRAVYHFLIERDEQEKYLKNLLSATKLGSFFILSTFSEDGPLKCSSLEIVRYNREKIESVFKENFKCIEFKKELHISPGNMEQKFNYWLFERIK